MTGTQPTTQSPTQLSGVSSVCGGVGGTQVLSAQAGWHVRVGHGVNVGVGVGDRVVVVDALTVVDVVLVAVTEPVADRDCVAVTLADAVRPRLLFNGRLATSCSPLKMKCSSSKKNWAMTNLMWSTHQIVSWPKTLLRLSTRLLISIKHVLKPKLI